MDKNIWKILQYNTFLGNIYNNPNIYGKLKPYIINNAKYLNFCAKGVPIFGD